VVIVLLVVIGVVVLSNMTPRKMHLEEMSLGSKTIEDYGLADVKIKNIVKGIKQLSVKESKIVDNGFSAEKEATNTKTFFADSNYANVTDYDSLTSEMRAVEFDAAYKREIEDTTLAYIFDNIFGNIYESTDNTDKSPVSVREVTITKQGSDTSAKGHMRVVLAYSTVSFSNQISTVTDKFGKFLPSMPSQIIVVCNADFTVNDEGKAQAGKIVFDKSTISANLGGDADNPIDPLVFDLFGSAFDVKSSAADDASKVFGEYIFDTVAGVINHIGDIGLPNTAGGKVVSNPNRGMNGVANHKLTIITRTK
jgi:hypothetical protein